MKRFRWFVIIFLGVGSLMLLGSIAFWNKTRHFLARAQQASGTVVELPFFNPTRKTSTVAANSTAAFPA